ncbi:MAG: DUF6587 family protein [Pseudomonadota bacterium]
MTPDLTLSMLIQYGLVGALLGWSLWRFLRTLMPSLMRNLQNRLAQVVAKAGWLRLGSWLQSGEAGAGCGSGCNTCGTCASPASATPAKAEAPVQWRHPPGH